MPKKPISYIGEKLNRVKVKEWIFEPGSYAYITVKDRVLEGGERFVARVDGLELDRDTGREMVYIRWFYHIQDVPTGFPPHFKPGFKEVVFSDRLERLEASVLEEPCHVVIMEEYLRCPFEKLTADTYWWRYRIALSTYKLRLNDSVTNVAAVEERSRRLARNQKEYDEISEINRKALARSNGKGRRQGRSNAAANTPEAAEAARQRAEAKKVAQMNRPNLSKASVKHESKSNSSHIRGHHERPKKSSKRENWERKESMKMASRKSKMRTKIPISPPKSGLSSKRPHVDTDSPPPRLGNKSQKIDESSSANLRNRNASANESPTGHSTPAKISYTDFKRGVAYSWEKVGTRVRKLMKANKLSDDMGDRILRLIDIRHKGLEEFIHECASGKIKNTSSVPSDGKESREKWGGDKDDPLPGIDLNGMDTTATRSQRKARMLLLQSTANASPSQAAANFSDDDFMERLKSAIEKISEDAGHALEEAFGGEGSLPAVTSLLESMAANGMNLEAISPQGWLFSCTFPAEVEGKSTEIDPKVVRGLLTPILCLNSTTGNSAVGKRSTAGIDDGGSSAVVIASQRAPAGVILQEMVATTAENGDADDDRLADAGANMSIDRGQ